MTKQNNQSIKVVPSVKKEVVVIRKIDPDTGLMENVPMSMDELHTTLLGVMLACVTLPESKVSGTSVFDSFPQNQKEDRPVKTGLKGMIRLWMGAVKKQQPTKYPSFMETLMAEFDMKMQKILDQEDGLEINQEVDDIEVRFNQINITQNDFDYQQQLEEEESINHAAQAAEDRHYRLAVRLALKRQAEQAQVELNDSLVQQILDGDSDVLSLDKSLVIKADNYIVSMNQKSFFKKELKQRASVLRDMSYRAERMMSSSDEMDKEYVQSVIRLANKTKTWCERRFNKPAPYSKRSLSALYNEAVQVLVDLGVFKEAFLKKDFQSNEPCSFFTEQAAKMVELKSNEDWANQIALEFYELNTPSTEGEEMMDF